jgi:hypothetical protein
VRFKTFAFKRMYDFNMEVMQCHSCTVVTVLARWFGGSEMYSSRYVGGVK